MRALVHNMIHMTEGEKLVAYWWLWLPIIVGVAVVGVVLRRSH